MAKTGRLAALVASLFGGTLPTVIQNVDPGDGKGTFDIVYHPHGGYVDRMCRRLGTKEDDSGNSVNVAEINGCYDYNNRIMYLSSPSKELFMHEYNHRKNPPVWNGKKWVYPKENRILKLLKKKD